MILSLIDARLQLHFFSVFPYFTSQSLVCRNWTYTILIRADQSLSILSTAKLCPEQDLTNRKESYVRQTDLLRVPLKDNMLSPHLHDQDAPLNSIFLAFERCSIFLVLASIRMTASAAVRATYSYTQVTSIEFQLVEGAYEYGDGGRGDNRPLGF